MILLSSVEEVMMSPVVPAVIALAGVVIGALVGARLAFRNQLRLVMLQSRQRSYAEIMGKKFLVRQLLVSRFEALAHLDYHERLWHLAGCPKESIDFDEAMRWMRKSEDLAIELTKAIQSLFESVGMACSVFERSADLEARVERLYNFKIPTIAPAPGNASQAALSQWKTKVVAALHGIAREEIGEPVDQLLDYLKGHMNDPVKY